MYSLDLPQLGASNEYPNVYFHGEIRKICTFWLETAPYLEL